MSIEHRFYVLANRNAEFFGRVRDDAQSFAELTFRIFAECSTCVASSFCQSGGSIRSLNRDSVEDRTSCPAEVIPCRCTDRAPQSARSRAGKADATPYLALPSSPHMLFGAAQVGASNG